MTLVFGCFLALMLVGPCSPLPAHLNRQAVDAFCATAQVGDRIDIPAFLARAHELGLAGNTDFDEFDGRDEVFVSRHDWTMMNRFCVLEVSNGVVTKVENFTHGS